jgi:predicted TIM-barrel fold metal-dependent hydrolase
MNQRGIAPLIIVAVIVVVAVVAGVGIYATTRGGGGGENNPPSGTYSGGPILIQNDYQFTAANGVVSGSGTVSDPYIIENWVIDASGANGIDIQNTAAYFVVRNCLIENSAASTHGGIRINNAANGTVENNVVCENFTDTGHMDMFDSHVHIMSTASTSLAITEMDKAGVSMALLYPIDGCDDSDSIAAMFQYPGRFVAFVDTPDSPEPATWYTEGQAFTAFADAQMRTGKFCGIGETNLRYYSTGFVTPPPDIYVPPDDPLWLRLVDMAAQYHVSISFHFIPDDVTANAALVRMMDHNADATLIWCHMGFNNTPLSSTALGNYLLEHPNLYFDACPGSAGWEIIANQSDGRLSEEWRQFFERWNSRIMFGTDAGGGPNGLERWLNYADNVVEGAAPNAVGYWRYLISNMDKSAAYNVMSGNARKLFLGEQRPAYKYLVPSDGRCYPITVISTSSVSGLRFDKGTRTVSFTVADSTNTTGSATITIPTALVRGNFTARIDGQSVQITEVSNSTYTTISLEYAGGIRTVALSASPI